MTTGDRFGASLAFVSGSSERALIIGVPDDAVRTTGLVIVLPLGDTVPRYWAPGDSGVPSAGASRFGGTLASSGV